MFGKIAQSMRAKFEIIVDDACLSVKHERGECCIAIKNLQQCVDTFDESRTEDLERSVPFTIPMGMWDDMIDGRVRPFG